MAISHVISANTACEVAQTHHATFELVSVLFSFLNMLMTMVPAELFMLNVLADNLR